MLDNITVGARVKLTGTVIEINRFYAWPYRVEFDREEGDINRFSEKVMALAEVVRPPEPTFSKAQIELLKSIAGDVYLKQNFDKWLDEHT